jgi:peroxiredoxin
MGRDYTDTLCAGDRAPDFTLDSSNGRPIRLRDALGEGPALLVFTRGTI